MQMSSRRSLEKNIGRVRKVRMKNTLCTATGVAGSFIVSLFGGWDTGIGTLMLFMVIDFLSGLAVAGIFKRSTKTKTGTLESKAGRKGLCRKCMTLLFVLIAHRLDLSLGTHYIRDTVIIGFMANELISIVENAGLMGLPLPAAIINAIDILNKKSQPS